MKKYLLLIFILSGFKAFSQRVDDPRYISDFTPPSPEAVSLAQYAEHPVSYFTGLPKIDIPLFEINSGRINVPISLSYYAEGIKVEQVASRMGMGWTLNAGGVVTRAVARYADEVSQLYSQDLNSYVNGYHHLPSNYSIGMLTWGVGNGQDIPDSEPDPHYYNMPGHVGKFYCTSPSDYLVIGAENIQINAPYDGSDDFVITTDDGLIYRFGATEVTWSSSSARGVNYAYSSSWYLTEIEDPTSGKTVTFTYITTDDNIEIDHQPTTTYSADNCIGLGKLSNLLSEKEYVSSVKILSRIDYEDEHIVFETSDREDLDNDKAYTAIKQYNNNNELIKGYSFDTSYAHKAGHTDEIDKRLFLDGISEIADDETSEERYIFNYKNPELLPPRDSYECDIWGYFNNNGANSFEPTIYLTSDTYGRNKYSVFSNNGLRSVLRSGFSRETNVNTIDYGTLEKITYPTGGSTTFIFEPDEFSIYKGGGLRIKEKTIKDSDGTFISKTGYGYFGGRIPGPIPQVAMPSTLEEDGIMTFYQNMSSLGSNSGGYVGYDHVRETKYDENGNDVGSIYYEYENMPDEEPSYIDEVDCNVIHGRSYYPFFTWQSNEIHRGQLKKETYYYSYDDQSVLPAKTIEYYYDYYQGKEETINMAAAGDQIKFTATRKIREERMLLTDKVETLNDNKGNASTNTTSYSYYTDYTTEHSLALKSKIQHAGNEYTKTEYKYPFNFDATASSGVMGKMVEMHYVSPVIQELNWSSYNSVYELTSAKITNYKEFGTAPNKKILPDRVFATKLTSPLAIASVTDVTNPASPGSQYEKRVEFKEYFGDKPELIVYDDHVQRLTWSTSRLTSSQILPTENTYTFILPTQNWSIVSSTSAKTGNEYYSSTGPAGPFPNLLINPQGDTYYISFWAKNGTVILFSNDGNDYGDESISLTAPSEWTLYNYKIEGPGWIGNLFINGTAKLDELRISNRPVQITTYNYDKFNRLIDIADPANTITHFRYDAFGRLMYTSDTNEDITEAFYYNFK